MKLIDEKIKALGLTKGQYCEKHGFKFKDFAAKVHTLEAKIEWANKFLKPLGLHAPVLPTDSAEAVRFFLAERLSAQMNDAEVRFFGEREAPLEVKGLAGKEEWSGWTPGSRETKETQKEMFKFKLKHAPEDDADSLL